MIPMTSRNVPETAVPMRPPTCRAAGMSLMIPAEIATRTVRPTTIVEWPSEKKSPTPTGRSPSCMSLRVELSIAAMWSASTAWRRPNV
jgi:hypothetical protein